MFKRSGLVLLLFCFFSCFRAVASVTVDPIFLQIVKENDQGLQERRLVKYIRAFYRSKPVDSLQAYQSVMDSMFMKYKINNRQAINYYIDYFYQQRLEHGEIAENTLLKAIRLAAKHGDNYLLYVFYTELGFLQTYRGNTSEAIYNYSMARKQAAILDNPSYQVTVDVNISDIFFRNGFYSQSLFYLKQAQGLVARGSVPEHHIKNTMYVNIAENYFRLRNIDSVRKYNSILHNVPDSAYNKYIFSKLTDYFISLLQHNYQIAAKQILALKTDSLYTYSSSDEQNLADAYYLANMPDSAKLVLTRLLADPSIKNHPEVKYHLYEVLGRIAEQQHDIKGAVYNFKMALQQSEEQIGRLTRADNISSQIRIDEAQDSYLQREEIYKKERLGLIYVLVIAILTLTIIGIVYSANRQKRYYEQLVFDAKKKELSFINSHEVRRHLSNILGLIDVIKNSDDKHKEYLEAEPYFLKEAENLDVAIKNISEKLEGDGDSLRSIID